MSIRIAIAQINPKLGDLEANLALYEENIRQAVEDSADLLLFPELSLTGYYAARHRAECRADARIPPK